MSPLDQQLTEALRSLCPDDVRVGALLVDDRHVAALRPAERDAVATAGPGRRREFATGRALLHRLLPDAGDLAVLPSRAPRLPAGVAASLAHDHDVAVAVAVETGPGRATLGVDLEAQVAFSPEEAAVVRRTDEGDLDPCLAFVLKEAAYKAWAGAGGELLEFHEVRLDVGDDAFTAAVRGGVQTFHGRHVLVAGRWLAVVVA